MADCEDEITRRILLLQISQGMERMKTAPGAVRATLGKVAAHLRAADIAARKLPLEYRSRLFPERRRQTMMEWKSDTPFRLHRLAVEAAIASIAVPPGGPRSSDVKFHAVKFAHDLLSEFGGPPTLYIDGLWPQLAALLCEAVGVPSGNMFHGCRDYDRWLTGKPRRRR
jgi:hypothetical protein